MRAELWKQNNELKKNPISEALKTKAAVPVVNRVSKGMAASEFEGWGV